jgi:hypothetical protein
MEITEGFDFNRFEEERPATGGEYELETFKYISGDLADNERLENQLRHHASHWRRA